MELQGCLNGTRTRAGHPAVPVTPEELAADAAAAVAAGARGLHVHPRSRDGRESLAASDIGAAVAAVRSAVPGEPVGVSTGLWITGGDAGRRARLVADWAELDDARRPDLASVNVSEAGWARVWGELVGAGIGVEAGVWSGADLDALLAAGVERTATRVLVELIGHPPDEALLLAEQLVERLSRELPGVPVLLHGEGPATWPVLELARWRGLPSRIGLEDVLTGPDGTPVEGNAALVAVALNP